MEPVPTPPLPTESFALPHRHQVPPYLLFHPVLNQRKAPAGVSYRKVVYPAPQNRVDKLYYPPHRLAVISSEDLPELCKQGRPLLQLGHHVCPPLLIYDLERGETRIPGKKSFP